MTISDDVLTRLPPESFEAMSRKVRDGDVLMCASHDPFSRLIGWSTKSPWTHVALAWRWPSLGRIMVFECVQHLGVHAVSLAKFISQTSSGVKPYPGKIILARHEDWAGGKSARTDEQMRRLADFAVDRFGDRFSSGEILKIAARIIAGRLNRPMPRSLGPKDEFICSEYVARCFEKIEIQIAWDGLGFIAPADFANDPKIHPVARFRTR